MDLYKLKNLIPKELKNKLSLKQRKKFTKLLIIINNMISGKKGKKDFLKSAISAQKKSIIVKGMPTTITIEPTTACDQKCPICETGNGTLGRKTANMKFGEFKKIIDMVAGHTNQIMFYFMGETFLNKDAYKMIKYARENNIWVSTCTNGNLIDPEKLIWSDISEIQFQINGMTQEVHEIYRVGGNLKSVKASLEETIRLKNKTGSNINIVAGFIVMKHNVHQIDEFKEYCNSIGVDRIDLIKPAVRNPIEARIYIPEDEKWWIYDKKLLEEKNILTPINPPNNYCDWLYFGVNIYVNGDVVPCCRDVSGKYIMGNVFEEPLEQIWNNDKFQKFRKQILTDQKKIDICRLCEGYGRPVLK
jgi:radical SAM protein with 4Fe4S-binding SPASM domain